MTDCTPGGQKWDRMGLLPGWLKGRDSSEAIRIGIPCLLALAGNLREFTELITFIELCFLPGIQNHEKVPQTTLGEGARGQERMHANRVGHSHGNKFLIKLRLCKILTMCHLCCECIFITNKFHSTSWSSEIFLSFCSSELTRFGKCVLVFTDSINFLFYSYIKTYRKVLFSSWICLGRNNGEDFMHQRGFFISWDLLGDFTRRRRYM